MKQLNKKVTFKENKHTFFYDCDKKYCYDKNRNHKKKQNRKLRTVERYMKQVGLLEKNEMLIFSTKTKHIRGDFINFIAKRQHMIKKREYVKIIN